MKTPALPRVEDPDAWIVAQLLRGERVVLRVMSCPPTKDWRVEMAVLRVIQLYDLHVTEDAEGVLLDPKEFQRLGTYRARWLADYERYQA